MIKVSNIERFAINDGPGIRTVVFLQSCPLNCPWCANPETRPLRSDKTKDMTVERILEIVLRDKDYYDNSGGGLTLSGGEATMQTREIYPLLEKARKEGLTVAIETCGEASEYSIRTLLPLVDIWLFDLKHTDAAVLKQYTGANLDVVLRNLKLVTEYNASAVVLRMPCIPGFNMDDKRFEDSFRLAVELGVKRVDLLPYHTLALSKYKEMGLDYPYQGYQALGKSDLEKYRMMGLSYGLDIKL